MISYIGMYDGKPANKFLGKIDRATYRMPTNDWSSRYITIIFILRSIPIVVFQIGDSKIYS